MAFFLIIAAGLAVGSFLNVVIGRLRSDEKGWRTRSRCPDCREVLRPGDLIPVLSFFLLQRRCRHCRKPISWQYPLLEGVTAVLFLAAYLAHGKPAELSVSMLAFLRDCIFIAGLTVVFVIDLRDMVVFDAVTVPFTIAAFIANVLLGTRPMNLLGAAAIGGGFFLFQYVVSRGRWIGGGDVRIGAMMGCMLGFPLILPALLAAYISGALAALALIADGKAEWSGRMAFGTFLSAATAAALLYGAPVLRWYASLLEA